MKPSPLFYARRFSPFLCARFRTLSPRTMVTKCPRGIRKFPWYTNSDACCSFFCAALFGSLRARAWDDLPAMSRHTTSKAHKENPRFFLRGAMPFFCTRFCTVARAWKGLFPVVVFHPGPRRKSGFPGLCQPVAHAYKPKPNPAVFRFKICGFPRVAVTTRGFSAGRT